MSNTPHELAEEFPQETARIRDLKAIDAHFARLVDDYHEVNREVHRAESLIEPVAPAYETELRQKRMILKDEIWKALQAA